MKEPKGLVRIVDGKRYSVNAATLIADDSWTRWAGNNYKRGGRHCFLYRTKRGNYFLVTGSKWMGKPLYILDPVTEKEAVRLYDHELTEHYEPHSDAFPNTPIEDA